ncbi:MAG: ComEC/Rec2 family competence protein [Clostridia bacterium]|nr:ComEC/Rec2 family competence protein [Clostridia bacterium]
MNPQKLPASQGRRYLVWLVVGFLLGVSYGLYHPVAVERFPFFLLYSIGFLLGLLSLILGLASLLKTPICSTGDFLLLWCFLLCFCLGIFRVFAFDHLQYQALRESAGLTHQYIGILTDNPAPSNSGKTYGFPVKILFLETGGVRQTCHGNILLYAPPELAKNLQSGDIISFSANLTPPADASFPGGFSMRFYLHRQHYLFLADTKTLFRMDLPYEPSFLDQVSRLGEAIRDQILLSVDHSFGVTSKESALLKGILLGVQEDFTPEQYKNFVDSGLLHITSVSGMHVVFLSQFFLFLFRNLRLSRKFSYFLILPVLFLFCAVAAFTPSICRSTIMMFLFFLAQILQREPDPLTSLSASALILLLLNPYYLTSYSFLLSFSSTLGIILFATPFGSLFRRPFQPKKKKPDIPPSKVFPFLLRFILNPAIASLSMTAGCLLGMGYFGMRFFRRINWGSFLANLCLLPLASSSFILGLINWPLSYLSPFLSRSLAHGPLRFILWCINKIAEVFSHPVFQITTPTPPASFGVPYLVFCIAIYFSLNPQKKNA